MQKLINIPSNLTDIIVISLVTAYIMTKIQVGMDDQVFAEIKKLEQIQEASATYGAFDLVIKVSFKTIEELDKFLFETIRKINGITETSSMIVAIKVV